MIHAGDLIADAVKATGSRACVGLDPRPSLLPPSLTKEMLAAHGPGAEGVSAAFLEFNRQIIEAIAGSCAAVKPQVACYEAYGPPGIEALHETVALARAAKVPVIIDAKRGDIGSTADHYHQAYFGGAPGLDDEPLGVPGADGEARAGGDWITVNGYLGWDGVTSIVGPPEAGRGAFVLVKTSNPSSGDLQDTGSAGTSATGTVAETMAGLVSEWGRNRIGASGLSDIGAVVGATYPDEARRLRELMPDTLFLVPGYGAQGASASDALAGARSDGSGVVISSSRGIIAAWAETDTDTDTEDWGSAAAGALASMNEALADY